ncbi:hypothetical protein HHK36_016711 [Tetracentron sinense]|uniref:Exostosin GT47 domain-containing protein n=1 Tax=Tetracentron sinense TaxID=13715 RepID=A0A835DB74_TETSI|nr:hypothetical protein HHK36_016711 [Tetracentron sinense]
MGDSKKKHTCCSSSSLKLLLAVVPLILVSGFACRMDPMTSSWVSFSSYYPWPWTAAIPSSSSSSSNATSITTTTTMVEKTVSSTKGSTEKHQDLHARVVGVHQFEEALSNASSFFNRSSSLQILQLDKRKQESLRSSINGSHVVPVPRTILLRRYSKLERLEAGLTRARSKIREAIQNGKPTLDTDFVPEGSMYWNSNAFHRSYLEMEKKFKIFIYEEGEPPVFHNGPCKSIYSMEGNFINKMEMDHRFRTRNPDKAHAYFLPFSVVMMVQFVYVPNSHDFKPIKQTVRDYVSIIARKYPYWNRSLGADHFMLSCHDWGPETSSSVPLLFKNSIRALCNANTSEGFNPSKDASIPEINLRTGQTSGLIGGPSPSRRPILAFFAGGLHGPIRPLLLEHWKNKDEDIQVHQYLPKGLSYYDMMRKSKYCICPSGYEVASPRIVEAIYTGCVPVLISDHYVPPFSDVLN